MANGIDIGSFTGSDFKGEEAIKKILEAQEKRKTPIENEQFRLQMQKEAWRGIQNKLSDLQNITRDFMSPAYSSFRKTKISSSDPNVLTFSVDNMDISNLSPAEYKILPKQLAMADHFKSDIIKETNIKPADFSVIYKNQTYPINFSGGTLEQLSDAINNQCDFLETYISQTGSGKVLGIKGKEVGASNKISFIGDTDFLKSLGLIRASLPSYYDIDITNPVGISGSLEIPDLLINQTLNLKPKVRVTKQIPEIKEINSESEFWLYLKKPIKNEDNPMNKETKPNTNTLEKLLGTQDKIWVGDVELIGSELITRLKPKNNSTQNNTQKIDDKDPKNLITISYHYSNGEVKSINSYITNFYSNTNIVKFSVPNGKIESITIDNKSIFNLSVTKGEFIVFNRNTFESKNPISIAQNAIINYLDIDYQRDSNTITDIIPGTIHMTTTSKAPITVSVGFDYDKIIEQLKNWLIAYNNAMNYIQNVSEDPADMNANLLNRNRRKELQEKKDAYEKLSIEDKDTLKQNGRLFAGFLRADSSLSMIKSQLQNFTKKPYTTDAKEKVRFLEQLGVMLPNSREYISMSDEDKKNYRAGYLDFTEESQNQFLTLLREEFLSVQQFFFKRTDNSKLYNQGMLSDYNELLKNYLQRYNGKLPGFFLSKEQILNSQIQAEGKKVEQMDEKIKNEEAKLRRDFSKVYESQSKSKSLGNQLSRFGRGD